MLVVACRCGAAKSESDGQYSPVAVVERTIVERLVRMEPRPIGKQATPDHWTEALVEEWHFFRQVHEAKQNTLARPKVVHLEVEPISVTRIGHIRSQHQVIGVLVYLLHQAQVAALEVGVEYQVAQFALENIVAVQLRPGARARLDQERAHVSNSLAIVLAALLVAGRRGHSRNW